MSDDYDDLPLAYARSGCSSAAQLANDLAVWLDRERLAEMSCIAGVAATWLRSSKPRKATALSSPSTAVPSNASKTVRRTTT